MRIEMNVEMIFVAWFTKGPTPVFVSTEGANFGHVMQQLFAKHRGWA